MTDEIVKTEPEKDVLTKRERAAYTLSLKNKEPFLSPGLADQFYRLFESGRSCEEIQELNKGISLGIICRARVDFGWDDRRFSHFEALREQARTQAQNLTLESVSFLGDVLTAFHRSDREKIQKFIQTGDVEDLKNVQLFDGFKTYQQVVELLMKLTGQDQVTTVHGVVEHHHTVDTKSQAKPLTSEEAAVLLLAPKVT